MTELDGLEASVDAACNTIDRLVAERALLLAALKAVTDKYADLVNSGDCGFWNPESEPEIIMARVAIAKVEGR